MASGSVRQLHVPWLLSPPVFSRMSLPAISTGIRRAVFELMLELNRSVGASLIIVTHDPELAKKAGRILQLVDGVFV